MRTAIRMGLAIAIGLAAPPPPALAQRGADRRQEAARLAQAGHVHEALDLLNIRPNRKPRDIESRVLRGDLLLRLNRPEAALTDFDAASRINPLSPAAATGRGIALVMLDRPEEALDQFARSIRLHALPLNKDRKGLACAHCGVGQVYHRSGRHERAIALDPGDPNGFVGRGDALVALGRLDEAVASYAEAIRRDPNHARAWGGRGDALARLGRDDQALADLDAAVQLDPTDAKARSLRGSLLAQRGENERALADF